jgi:hypothetical protein
MFYVNFQGCDLTNLGYAMLDSELKDYLHKANKLFTSAMLEGKIEKIRATLLNRPYHLVDFDSHDGIRAYPRRCVGIHPIPLVQICGTLGRIRDFDVHFHPLNPNLRNRWTSVACARMQNIPLEPVSLIKVADCYYVQDGHHRISVAHTLGEEHVDAEITLVQT